MGVLAQFGGVTLAFAFISLLAINGVLTVALDSWIGLDIYGSGWLFGLNGLIVVYVYFQIPLMVIVFTPALEGLRPQWREAAVNLGATTPQYWRQVGIPLLTPAFLGSALLLFANAFAAYATAAVLVSQGNPIIPLFIRSALTSEVLLGQANVGFALALEMIVVVSIVMGLYALLLRRTSRWMQMKLSIGFRIFRGIAFALFALYFALPLLAMLDFSTRAKGDATGRTWDAWIALVENENLREAIISSLLLAVFTVLVMVVLLVPTMIWVRLRVPAMSRTVEFLCLLPLTIPALVIVVGIANVYAWVTYLFGDSALTLTFVYVVLVLPYSYRAIDSALAAIDVVTLAEAARSLGASWFTVIVRIVFPNIISGVLSAAFISVALVLGEFTVASLLHFDTMPVALTAISKSDASTAIAGALASIIVISVLLLGLSLLSRDRRTKGIAS